MSPTLQCIWGDSLGSAAAAVVWVVYPDLRLCPDSRQFGDQNSPKSVLAFGVPVAVPLIFGELLDWSIVPQSGWFVSGLLRFALVVCRALIK